MWNLAALQMLAQNNGGDAAAGAAGSIMGLFCCCLYIVVPLTLLSFWIWMIVEVTTKEPSEDPNKMMWVLIVILAGFIGALIYFFARRGERKRKYGR